MSHHITDISYKETKSDSAETPPQLAKVGLRRASKMSRSNESHRLLRSQRTDKEDNELFVKLPKFSKRPRGKLLVCENQEEDSEGLPSTFQKLYKFLNQPNCQRWIWCEFIESYIDKPILAGSYDTNSYMLSRYPQLQMRNLPLRSWQIIRRNMGKARRFSPAFIAGERVELERCRRIVRLLQQRKFDKVNDAHSMDLMPKLIPMPLAVDTEIISLLKAAITIICKGRIVSFDPKNSNYLVKFDMAGKHMVRNMPDCLLHSLQESKSMPLAKIMKERQDKQQKLSGENEKNEQPNTLLDALLQLQKLLVLKRKTVQDLTAMNEELEVNSVPTSTRRDTKVTPQREKLQRRYATNIIKLHRVNVDILEPLRVVHNHLNGYENDTLQRKGMPRNKLYEKCRALAEMDLKATAGHTNVHLEATRELIMRLQTLLYLCGELGQGNNIELDSVMDDFVNNMLVGFPHQLSDMFEQVIGPLQSIRELIQNLSTTEPESRPQIPQLQNLDSINPYIEINFNNMHIPIAK